MIEWNDQYALCIHISGENRRQKEVRPTTLLPTSEFASTWRFFHLWLAVPWARAIRESFAPSRSDFSAKSDDDELFSNRNWTKRVFFSTRVVPFFFYTTRTPDLHIDSSVTHDRQRDQTPQVSTFYVLRCSMHDDRRYCALRAFSAGLGFHSLFNSFEFGTVVEMVFYSFSFYLYSLLLTSLYHRLFLSF